MTDTIRPQPGILDIALYVAGDSKVAGVDRPLKLSSNENPFGPSPAAIEAFRAAAGSLHRYPSSDHAGLRAAIGAVHGLDADRIICGAGSDEVITLLCQAYAGPGDEIIHTEHGFLMYRISALGAGARPVAVPERERVVDVDEILAAVTPRTRLVFLANPANPTGTMLPEAELARLADRLAPGVLVVLDGAYAEYAAICDGAVALATTRPNVVVTRTFSKLHGLGGLRIGWGYGPRAVIDVLNRLRAPFNLSTAQLDAAEAAVRDRAHAAFGVAENARLRAWLAERLRALGLGCDTSQANFVLARFADAAAAAACDAALRGQGIIVRGVAAYGLAHCLRITVGTEADCARLVAAVAAHLGAGGA
ncbi:MAG: histidinol-phosphate transaminase [Rhodobacteraceae bacterium]|jgi:histidinol-phosphate aminotransferase|nr:histidinol-phosphate transaminase [Paracoccaceae bacterium]